MRGSYNRCGCYHSCRCRRYGFHNFVFDLFMIVITCGLWLVWIIVRELANR